MRCRQERVTPNAPLQRRRTRQAADSAGLHVQQVHRSRCKAGDWPERVQAAEQLQQLEALLQAAEAGPRRGLRCGLG